jgi:hypothetical protein
MWTGLKLKFFILKKVRSGTSQNFFNPKPKKIARNLYMKIGFNLTRSETDPTICRDGLGPKKLTLMVGSGRVGPKENVAGFFTPPDR